MVQVFIARCIKSVAFMALCLCAALFFHAGCGGGNNVADLETEESLNVGSVEDLIFGDSYAGYLAVHLDEGMEVRLEDETKALVSKSGDVRVDSIRDVLSVFPDVEFKRPVETDPDKLDEIRAHLEKLSGRSLTDWNSIYYIEIPEPAEAIELYNELKATAGVQNVYPKLRPKIQSLATTPDLTGLQGYLYPEATHGGLNAQAAWSAGAVGSGVYVVFNESGVNFDHEDLGLIGDYDINGGNMFHTPDCAPGLPPAITGDCDVHIAHGTAGAGVVVAQANGSGVTGMTPDAYYLNVQLRSTIAGAVLPSTDGIDTSGYADDDIEPGSIWVLPVADDLQGGFNGNAPVSVVSDTFAAIQQATAYGVTVVIGAGNGDVDLDNPALYTSYPFLVDLTQNDSGAIMVGASIGTGNNQNRADFSNCGNMVDMFAWGSGVVTTGYLYGDYAWEAGMGITPPNSDVNSQFVNNHGGTSAATAIVAGAAVAVQSHFKNTTHAKAFLMPNKIKEFLYDSGVTQSDGGCSIGRQPRIDVALDYVNQFVANKSPLHPKFQTGTIMSEQEMLDLRNDGIGLVCIQHNPVDSHPSCPHTEIYPAGTGAAPDLDFDSDGRADLVQWTNGTWKLDLSGYGTAEDGFGDWDIEFSHPPIIAKWVAPYVEDLNADSMCDFIVYDKEHNTWYVKYMTSEILMNQGLNGQPWVWDEVITYPATTDYYSYTGDFIESETTWQDTRELDPSLSQYSRPYVMDFGSDGVMDLTVACSDGYWRVDTNIPGHPLYEGYGDYDAKVKYLTDAQLAQAPGWAYSTSSFAFHPLSNKDKSFYMYVKVPDGLPEAGRVIVKHNMTPDDDELGNSPIDFGGNDSILLPGRFDMSDDYYGVPAIKDQFGEWQYATIGSGFTSLQQSPPGDIYGGSDCHPIVADFDGDGFSDQAVMCPDEWRIMYSDFTVFQNARNPSDNVRYVDLPYDTTELSLPGRGYAGGITYEYAQQLIQAFQYLYPGIPPPIPIDAIYVATH